MKSKLVNLKYDIVNFIERLHLFVCTNVCTIESAKK